MRKLIDKHIFRVTKDACTLKELYKTKSYKLRKKIDKKEKLTREEKNWLTANVIRIINGYNDIGIYVLGYIVRFNDVVHKFLIQKRTYHVISYGIDKKALHYCYTKINKIIKLY